MTTTQVSGGAPHPLRALLVDRDADTRHMYAEFLQLGDCEIEEAEDGREALAKALTRSPDVVVTETRLLGISGFDLCRILREDSITREIPIIVVTGDAFERDVERARSVGADSVLTKPCLPATLASEVRRVLTHTHEWRAWRATQTKVSEQLARSAERLERSGATHRRAMMSHVHNRRETTTPPVSGPPLVCPACDQPLKYVKSYVGGVSIRHQEQWDYLECSSGCGTFQYRHRTRKLRRV